MTDDNSQVRVGIYARKSTADDDVGAGRLSHSVDAQLKKCRELARRLGWKVVNVYPEDDTSAFKKRVVTLPDGRRVKRNVRPLWTELLTDLYDGRITALIAYDLDRSMREPRDLEDLIEIVEQRHRRVESVTGSLRLTNDTEIMSARIGVTVANKSSRDTSRRVIDSMSWRVEAGRWHGGRVPFGYRITGGTVVALGNGEQRITKGRLAIDHVRAAKIRDAAKRVLRGESLYSVAEEWNDEGFLTSTGKHWRTSALAKMLTRPTLIGMREFKGKLYPATWKPILTEDTRDRLLTLMSDPARRFQPSAVDSYGSKRYALGGIVHCGGTRKNGRSCGTRLIGQTFQDAPRLICHSQATGGCGSVSVGYLALEEFVLDILFASLDSPEWHAEFNRQVANPDDRSQALKDDLESLAEQRRRVGEAYTVGAFALAEMEARVSDIKAQEEKLQSELTELIGAQRFDHIHSADDARGLLTSAHIMTQRAMLSRFITSVVVAPHPVGMPRTATRRRGETDESFASRRREITRAALRARVDIRWRR